MPRRSPLLLRLTLSALLPFVLLFTQLGAQLHELSHWHVAAAPASSGPQASSTASADADLCLDCLAFAQVAGLAQFDVPAPPDADGLRHHLVAEVTRSVADAARPATRTRGPPLFS